MASTTELLEKLKVLINKLNLLNSGGNGFEEVTPGNNTANQDLYYSVKAVNGDLTLGSGTTVRNGDPPAGGDVILEGDVLFGRFKNVEVDGASSGKAYVYFK